MFGFSPFLVAVCSAQPKEKEDNGLLALLITNYIFQSIIFGVHWIVFTIFGHNLGLNTFFESGNSILFYLPFFGGMLHFGYFMLLKKNYIQKTKAYGMLNVFITLVSALSIVLQLVNYLLFLKRVW